MIRQLMAMPTSSQDEPLECFEAGNSVASYDENVSSTSHAYTDEHSTPTISTPGTMDAHIYTSVDADTMILSPSRYRVSTAERNISSVLVPPIPLSYLRSQ